MAQKREKEETLELQVPSNPITTTGCGSAVVGHLPEPDPVRPRSNCDRPSSATVSEEERSTAEKRGAKRCFGCRKRVGLTGFRCRCGDLFCSEHRYSDRHECSFDYKAAGRAAIARENPVVRAAKILKV